MNDLNVCLFEGNCVRDPELRRTQGGTAVANFTIAVVSKVTKDKTSGEWNRESSFLDCVAWGELAENLVSRVNKGDRVYVQGSVQTEKWVNKTDNTNRQKHTFKVDRWSVVQKKKGNGGAKPENAEPVGVADAGPVSEAGIPF